ncbi:hypothetical protein C7T94_13720 [Pedobacter yulinensis]|uniref:Uncharacterized protein n=1 Tax=Pedobacter yulinensis TaxID=2126353 RepID=A0A2T3HMC8_9SPHI|nr:hypothetical protein [Pedobacter yulinensis]PST83595.1 hypothetical protein C7T94_13720 [Pedobacter yulinensis]
MEENKKDQEKQDNLTDLNEQMKGSDADYDHQLAENALNGNPDLTNDKDSSEDKDYFAHLADQVDNNPGRDQDDAAETEAREDENEDRN